MTFVSTDHPHNTLAPDDLAISAHFPDRCPDFHEPSPDLANELADLTVNVDR